ncbi:MAG: NADH-quinone oxidoreductase subunit M [Chloroflexi bacterium]|nr:NADH-quinone oxidoreductase subunit M [Chloroflexota bacterium]
MTLIVFLPLIGAVLVALVPARTDRTIRYLAVGAMAWDLALTLAAWALFVLGGDEPLAERLGQYGTRAWIPGVNAVYALSLDGLSLPLSVLTALLGLAAVLASWHIAARVREYHVWLLVLVTGVQGVFAARDLLLFFLFWEVELVPMYLLIAVWGTGRKEYSAMKFVLYTVLGSAFMLVGVLVLRLSTGTFDMEAMTPLDPTQFARPLLLSMGALFLFFLLAFAIKLPVWPLHTWLPDAHTDAPTAVSVMLAGILLKMGGYGIIRINLGFFPEVAAQWAPLLAVLAVVNILYGAAVVFHQHDLKRLIAYSSVSHMGIVLLGVASLKTVGVTGAAMQMFAHGTITGLLFLLVGLLYDHAHTRHIPDLGGLATRMPVIATVFVLAGLASLGLPLLSGFVAELTVFLGTFGPHPVATVLAAFGIVLTAGYILWMAERVLFGPPKERFASVRDAAPVDVAAMAVLVAPIVLFGVYPAPLMGLFEQGVRGVLPLLGG